MKNYKKGLEGVVSNQTSISSIDGIKGVLRYRGYNIKDLAKYSNYEEVAYLLLYGELPSKSQLRSFSRKLRKERKIDKSVLSVLKYCPKRITGMDALRTATSYLSHCDKDLNNNSLEAYHRKALRLTAKFPTILANFYRIKNNKKLINPRVDLNPGENFLYMLGNKYSKLQAKAIELDFLLTAEHGINASTFTTRVATSTLTDYHSAVVAGLCTLKGPLHGAAREKIYNTINEIKDPKKADKFVMDKIKKHKVIMGFGHRVYKAMDPRAIIFKQMGKELAEEKNNFRWHDISTNMEKAVQRELVEKKGKPIYPNVDFFTAEVYKYAGIPLELTTGIFALGRIAGWSAHIMEQFSDNRLIRPLGNYIGPKSRKYIPIGER